MQITPTYPLCLFWFNPIYVHCMLRKEMSLLTVVVWELGNREIEDGNVAGLARLILFVLRWLIIHCLSVKLFISVEKPQSEGI